MTNKEKSICELLLFHSTTKDNLKGIMKEGIKPGMPGGWCDLEIKRIEREEEKEVREKLLKDMQDYKEECKKNIFLSPDFHALEEEMPRGSETIIATCLPKEKVFIPSRKLHRYVPFEEWEKIERSLEEEYNQVIAKETIPPRYIIGCLDVEGKREWGSDPGVTKFKINKNCD